MLARELAVAAAERQLLYLKGSIRSLIDQPEKDGCISVLYIGSILPDIQNILREEGFDVIEKKGDPSGASRELPMNLITPKATLEPLSQEEWTLSVQKADEAELYEKAYIREVLNGLFKKEKDPQ